MTASKLLFGLIGNKVQNSRSPFIHHQFGVQCNLDVTYLKIEAELDEFSQCVKAFQRKGAKGCNITHPFKEEAYHAADVLSDRAALAKSVNTFLFTDEGKIYGDTTDGIGFVADVTLNIGYSIYHKTVVILGAGGSVRSLLHPVLMERPRNVIIANRTLLKAERLAAEFSSYGAVSACEFSDLSLVQADVVIDATSFDAEISLPSSFTLSDDSLCYDLKYTQSASSFLTWAKANHAGMIADGMGMLVAQAAESFYVWTGERPDVKSLIALIR